MGIRNWFGKKKDTTPDGSPILRSTPKDLRDMLGVPAQDTAAFAEQREQVYRELFGAGATVSHEVLSMVPHIDVWIYPPGHAGRPFYTLVSSGMSDLPMELPEGVDRSYRRREIILYCDAPEEAYIGLVRYFARFPHQYSTWLGPGHTVPNGDPPAPMYEGSELVAVLLADTVVRPDGELAGKLVLDGDPVHVLWPVPITQAELELKLKRGYGALLDLFDEAHHPVVLNPRRASYV
jgi:hypothetical protein